MGVVIGETAEIGGDNVTIYHGGVTLGGELEESLIKSDIQQWKMM